MLNKKLYQNKEIAALHRINKFLGCIDDLEHLLQLIMQEASLTVGAEASSIALYDSKKKDLYFKVSTGEKGSLIKEVRVKLGQGIIGYAAQKRKPLNIKDVSKDKRFHSDLDKKTQFKSKSILAIPIIYKNNLIGALEVLNKKGGGSFLEEDVKLLEIVAGQAAIAIENAKLYQMIIRKHTALKIKHQRLIDMQKKMLTMERMSAIGDMASRMVHDLRNPLTVIRGYAEMMKLTPLPPKDIEESSKIIVDEVDRLTGMTSEVMDFVRGKTTLSIEDWPIEQFLNELNSYLKRDFEPHNIQLVIEPNYKGLVYMDKHKIQRAIFNITSNAKDAMPKGGIFKISTDLNGTNVEVRLSDTGIGIPAEIKDKLCQPFATFGKAHGTGLGLAIVKKVIESHKGKLSIESQAPQEGKFSTTFTFSLPLKPVA